MIVHAAPERVVLCCAAGGVSLGAADDGWMGSLLPAGRAEQMVQFADAAGDLSPEVGPPAVPAVGAGNPAVGNRLGQGGPDLRQDRPVCWQTWIMATRHSASRGSGAGSPMKDEVDGTSCRLGVLFAAVGAVHLDRPVEDGGGGGIA